MSNEYGFASVHRVGDPVLDGDAGSLLACPVTTGLDRDRMVVASRRFATLVAAIGTGDRAAFTEFYRLTSPRVFGLAARILRGHVAAAEVTKEVYLEVWSTADRYDAALSSPVGWITTIAHRHAIDRVRAEASCTVREAAYAYEVREHDVVAEAVTRQWAEQSGCLDALPATQREAITLAYYTGRTYREVAGQLSVPLSTIKIRLRDGLRRLEKCLPLGGTGG
ncbi:sigma-70 family RNA polymerase sigma factor [Nocardia iowensis]|uniref:Sigma-70 family RNA polymerase sigma factor n=1 Tax=Nocardia iowensis TaxID=204891 RepID=A0ABX8RIR0_NOCIO|nr:sigma-70 family RNA polymerase sigma factor [Nocardia iowensis]QXN89488.1 sigma-70 family RNA polymerase sigma factor [Nocardia iowensis]